MTRTQVLIPARTALAVLLVAPCVAAQGLAGDETELKPGERIEREIGGREEHRYRLSLAPGTFVRVEAMEKGVDLVLSAFDPAGFKLREANAVLGKANGPEAIVFVGEEAGDFRVVVRPSRADALRGRYELNVSDLRPATAEDRQRARGAQLQAEARRLWQEGSAESLEKALPLMGEALEEYRRAGAVALEARVLGDMGLLHMQLGRPAQALAYYERSLPRRRAGGDPAGEAITLSNMGVAYGATGRLRQALASFQEALSRWRQQPRHPYGEGLTLFQLGNAFLRMGEYQAALDALRESVEISRAHHERANEAMALAILGQVYERLGEHETARRHLLDAQSAFGALGDRRGEGRTLHYLAGLHKENGNPVAGMAAGRRAADLFRAVGDREWEAIALVELATVEAVRGRTAEASTDLERARNLARQLGDPAVEASALAELARLRLERGERARAEELLVRARPLAETGSEPGTLAEVRSLAAMLLREAGDLEGARRESAAALDIVESLRGAVVAPELRATYRSAVHEFYQRHLDILMDLHRREPSGGHAAAALEAVERGKARALVELLGEGRLDLRGSVAVELRQREQEAHARIAWLQTRLMERRRGKPVFEEPAALEKDLQAAEDERARLEEEVRRTSPLYAQVRYPRPLRLPAIQALLEPEDALLAYSLGRRSYVFVVTREQLGAWRLPPEAAIGAEVQRLRESLRRPRKLQRARYVRAARRLFDLAVAPASAMLWSRRRLLIVPDGPLEYVPFEALLAEEPSDSRPHGLPYLLRRWEVAYVPSATTLFNLRERRVADERGPGRSLVALADPVVEGWSGSGARAAGGEVLRGLLDDLGLQELPRLPESRREVEALGRLFSSDEVVVYTGPAATEENLRAALSGEGARRLHFATHALVSTRADGRSALVLSRAPGSREDGLLQAFEISGLSLNAELVVLSACETGLGRPLRGEGLVGLARAFLQAGAARVAASLWAVADRSTADLMVGFYRHLDHGVRAAEALRRAKLELIAGQRFAEPYYWAPFVLIGEP